MSSTFVGFWIWNSCIIAHFILLAVGYIRINSFVYPLTFKFTRGIAYIFCVQNFVVFFLIFFSVSVLKGTLEDMGKRPISTSTVLCGPDPDMNWSHVLKNTLTQKLFEFHTSTYKKRFLHTLTNADRNSVTWPFISGDMAMTCYMNQLKIQSDFVSLSM